MKEVGVTQTQFNQVWNRIPARLRFFAEDNEKAKHGYAALKIGELLIWVDQYLPHNHVDQDVTAAVKEAIYG